MRVMNLRHFALPAALLAAGSALGADIESAKPVTAREALGWKLFFDPILSRPNNFSCSSCHLPDKGWESGVPLAKGAHGDLLPRHVPTVVNLEEAEFFFWDGRAESLEEQAKGPIANPIELDLKLDEAVARVSAEPYYRKAFAALGVQRISIDDIAGVIADFERRLITGETAYDRWLQGDRSALSEAQNRGRMTFFTTGQCALCHIGHNFTDGDFHNIGTATEDDKGRYAVTKDEAEMGMFKTPSLRNWKGREPFMHDGRFATLRDVVDFYSEPQDSGIGETEIDPLELGDDEKADLLAFMEALNGPWPDLKPFEAAWRKLIE